MGMQDEGFMLGHSSGSDMFRAILRGKSSRTKPAPSGPERVFLIRKCRVLWGGSVRTLDECHSCCVEVNERVRLQTIYRIGLRVALIVAIPE